MGPRKEQTMAFSAAGNTGPLADINVTPLVDVMLVLLIIFIVTAPMMARPITVDLPQHSQKSVPRPDPPTPIALQVDAANQVTWNGEAVDVRSLQARMQAVVQADPANPPELRFRADPNSEYAMTAKVLAAAKNARMEKIAFVQ